MTRWKAAGIHLALSGLIGLAVAAAAVAVWYPNPFFEAMGGIEVLAILVAVDVILGPLVTLVVFSPTKARHLMRLDFTVIGLVQVAALAYGIGVFAQARPAYMVFAVDRFDLVAVNHIRDEELAKVTRPEFKAIPWFRPPTVAARTPADQKEQMRVIESALAGKGDLQMFPQHYVPYAEMARDALAKSKPLADLRQRVPSQAGEVDAKLAALGRKLEDTRYLPLKARAKDFTVLLDGKTGEVVGFLKISPW